MSESYEPYIPQNIGEIMDLLGFMTLKSPSFEDDTGYFPGRNIDSEFFALNHGLELARKKLGDDRYSALLALSDRIEAHFKADPNDENGEALKGRELILEMEDILMALSR